MITGTPAFFDGRQGVQGLPPLAARLSTTFSDPRFDNPRAPQIRLPGFDLERLVQVGVRVRDIFADGSPQQARVRELVDDAFLADMATAVAGRLGGQVGIVPRLYLRKLIGEVLDLVELYPGLSSARTRRISPCRGNDGRRAARRRPRQRRSRRTTSRYDSCSRPEAAVTAGFAMLHPVIRHHIANTLGWNDLRALQQDAVAPVLEGTDALLIAPTAGGKTEAAIFPLLSAMAERGWLDVSVSVSLPAQGAV